MSLLGSLLSIVLGSSAVDGPAASALAPAAAPVIADILQTGHVVEPGQTLWSIAYHYGVRPDELAQMNALTDPATLSVGQQIRVPAHGDLLARGIPSAATPSRLDEPRTAFAWPLRGRITSRYGRRRGSQHSGVDIAATSGTIVVAAAGGRVARAGTAWKGYGRVVLVDHGNGFKSLYSHLARSFVAVGDPVEQGQAVGAVGATGNATGPHLHFEIWDGERARDPLGFLESGAEARASLP